MIKILKGLPSELTNSNTLNRRMANEEKNSFVLNVNKSLINEYNKDMDKLGVELKSLENNSYRLSFKMRQIGFFMVRALVIITAFTQYRMISFIISLLQFIVLPYSLSISICYGFQTSLMLFTGHVLVFPIIKYFVDLLCPQYLNIYIPFSPLFAFIFLIIDQIICALCLIKTPQGPTTKISLCRISESVWYGFLNNKTYYLVLIPLLFGHSFPVTVWILDAILSILGISTMIHNHIFGFWQFQFYHIHRMGHINNVYPDAHKFHHYLHDTTAFDGDIYGSGAPEEWLLIIIEFLIATLLCGGVPPSMSYWLLSVSWHNKWEFHSRCIREEKYHSDNFHADHHLRHIINFGSYYPLEMTFNTAPNGDHVLDGYKIKRVESDNQISLQFTPCS